MSFVSYELKRKCAEAALEGQTLRKIYEEIFVPENGATMTYRSFKNRVADWKRMAFADPMTEWSGTYPGMKAHAATVQVSSDGRVVQSWIRNAEADIDWNEIVATLKNAVVPFVAPRPVSDPDAALLEIPLFDLHFGIATYDDYAETLQEIVDVISAKTYAEIHLIVGQDCLHTNDLRGHTASGRDIGRVNIPRAWSDAWSFWCAIVSAALGHSPRVVVHYSRGNHDEALSWAFTNALSAAFPLASFDTTLEYRKAFFWRGVFVGFGHLEYTRDPSKVFRDFVLEFPEWFAAATCRELHAGHLHRESCDNGFMVRRLASAVPADDWSTANGYVGAHKRFQLFEFSPGRLRSVIYV